MDVRARGVRIISRRLLSSTGGPSPDPKSRPPPSSSSSTGVGGRTVVKEGGGGKGRGLGKVFPVVFILSSPLPIAFLVYDRSREFRDKVEERFPGTRRFLAPVSENARNELADGSQVKSLFETGWFGKSSGGEVGTKSTSNLDGGPTDEEQPSPPSAGWNTASKSGTEEASSRLSARLAGVGVAQTDTDVGRENGAHVEDLRSESALVGDGSDQASAMDVMTSALSKVQKWIDQLIRRKATPSGELAEEKEVKQVGRRDAEVESTEAALSELSATISAQLEELARLEEDAAKLRFELESRSKWEAVRLEELLRATELEERKRLNVASKKHREKFDAELAADYNKVKVELEDDISKEIDGKVTAMVAKMEEQLRQEFNRVSAGMEREKEREWTLKVQQLQEEDTRERQKQKAARLAALKDMQARMVALTEQKRELEAFDAASAEALKAATKAMLLETVARTGRPFVDKLGELFDESSADESDVAALRSYAVNGIPTVTELKQHYNRVARDGRTAAMVPTDRSIDTWTWLLATIASALKVKDVESEGSSPNAVLLRAERKLDEGDLKQAVVELEKLEGLPAEMCKDWITSARSRILLEQITSRATIQAEVENTKVA